MNKIIEIISGAYFVRKKHCWRSYYIMSFFVGLTIASLAFGFWPSIQSNLWYLYAVIAGFGYSGIAMVYYLIRYGRK